MKLKLRKKKRKETMTVTWDKIELFIDGKQIHNADSMNLTYTIEPSHFNLKPPKSTCRIDIKTIKEKIENDKSLTE